MTLGMVRLGLNTHAVVLMNLVMPVGERVLARERISSLQQRMEIPGVTECNGAKNIYSVNNNTIVLVVQ